MDSKIEWKECPGLNHLMISESGLCHSLKYKRLLKLQVVGKGKNKYIAIGYRDESGKSKHKRLNIIVATLFVPNPLNKPIVNHLDGDKLNNSKTNLAWATHSENSTHAVDSGLNPKIGEANHNSKLKNEDIPTLKQMYKEGVRQNKISSVYGISQSVVSRVVNNKLYTKI